MQGLDFVYCLFNNENVLLYYSIKFKLFTGLHKSKLFV